MLPIVIIDGIDPALLKTYTGGAKKGERSLKLLQRLVEKLGDKSKLHCHPASSQVREFRAMGGVAHIAGSELKRPERRWGLRHEECGGVRVGDRTDHHHAAGGLEVQQLGRFRVRGQVPTPRCHVRRYNQRLTWGRLGGSAPTVHDVPR
ncbi:hypothetical protein ACIO14_07120 [Nocardia fluminea]|uniref:hypothetical protein n=1 Tax=Nocardia fluminea TaxID=134984 RepID=UPI00380B4097